MAETEFSWELFTKLPVIGIIRNLSFKQIKEILPIYKDQGFNTVEITMNTPNAEEIIRYAVNHFGKYLNVGAGTVCSPADLNIALETGAGFIVTPIINQQVIDECVRKRVCFFPGAFTPTEIYEAWNLGAEIVKIFPASSLGSDYIKEIRGPLNQIKLLPTGGIGLHNCVDFLESGAFGLGIGSQLFSNDLINKKEWKALGNHFASFVKKIKEYQLQIKVAENSAHLPSASSL